VALERPLRQWDFAFCPPKTNHVIVGAGDGPCVGLAMSSRENQQFGPYGEYTADETAAKYGASPSETTQDDSNIVPPWEISHPAAYQDGWLPGP
jgi:oxalate decarboxylase/phosphoglucose isomerase-like protein (cupin superfamily)